MMLTLELCFLYTLLIINNVASNIVSLHTGTYCELTRKSLPNYYWRKYDGIIPIDAIPGGHTPDGRTTYIGQVLVLGKFNASGIIPGVIHVGETEVEAPFQYYRSDKYAAILCSNTPEAFAWKQIKHNELHLITDYLVVGGYEIDQVAYIGRASYHNNLIVGKVFNQRLHGLRIATTDEKEIVINSFEILVYLKDAPLSFN